MTTRSNTALKAALVTNRGVAVDADARLVVADDGNDATNGFATGQDPVLRFAYTYKTTSDTSTFFVGFRVKDATDFTPGVGVTVTRDGSVATAAFNNTWTVTTDIVEGDGVVYVAIKPTNLDTINGGIEVAVDLNDGETVVLNDLRYDTFG